MDMNLFIRLLQESPSFSLKKEKDDEKMTKKTFGDILAAKSMQDIADLNNSQLEDVVKNISALCGEQGPYEEGKGKFLLSLKKTPSTITERII